MVSKIPTPPEEDHEESFFVSMTDMMVGMIFLFIIMLMFFAMKFSDDSLDLRAEMDRLAIERDRLREQVELLQGAERTRNAVVEQIYTSLKDQGVEVVIDKDNGILRLPESILFAVGKSELSSEGRQAVAKLANALALVLPCYTRQPNVATPDDCTASAFGLEALLIEGHTDSDGAEDMNWRLSMERALHTYQVLVKERPELSAMCSRQDRNEHSGYPLLSIAGYGFKRPVAPNDLPENKNRNRRIDLRFIMTPPDKIALDTAKKAIQ